MEGECFPQDVNQGWSVIAGDFNPDQSQLSGQVLDELDAGWVHNLPELVRARTLAVQAILDALTECAPELFIDEEASSKVTKSVQGASLMVEAYSYSERAGDLKDQAGELADVPVMQAVIFLLEQSTIDQPDSEGKEKRYKPISKGDVRRMAEAIVRYSLIQQQPAETENQDGV